MRKQTLRSSLLFCLALVGLSSVAFAQGGLVGGEQEAVGNLKLQLRDIEKPALAIPPVNNPVETKDIQYEEKEIPVKTDYQPLEVKAPQPPKVEMPPLLNNLVKVGFGRFGSPYAKLYLNSGRNLDGNVGLDFSHVSSSKGYVDYAEFRDDQGGVKGEYFIEDNVLRGAFRLQNTNYFYFQDTIIEGHPEWKDTIRNTFTRMEIEAAIAKSKADAEAVHYDVGLRFNGYFDKHRNMDKGRDIHIGLAPQFDWKITDRFSADVKSNFVFSNSFFDSLALTRFFLDLTPTVKFNMEGLEVIGGIKLNSLADSNTHFSAYPILTASYHVLPGVLNVKAGLTGETHYLRYYDLVGDNRYIDRNLDIRPMRDRAHVYVGVDGQIAKYLSYDVSFYTRKIKDQLIYYSAFGASEFQMLYDSNFTQSGVKLALVFNKSNKVRAGVTGDFRSFRTSNIAYNFNMPSVQVDFWGSYNFADKVLVGTEVYLFGNRVMSLDTLGAPIEQGITADINVSAAYRFSERISVFLELNNLLGNNWQRWYGYRERPFDVKAGVTFAF
jgi:hypothetical protein